MLHLEVPEDASLLGYERLLRRRHVVGRAPTLLDLTELAEIARPWEPRPWAEGQRNLVVRIPWTEVTGGEGTGITGRRTRPSR